MERRGKDERQERRLVQDLIGKGSGETFQIGFDGPGWVLIQPQEGPTVPDHSHPGRGGGGGGLGSFFED